jgi:extracellular factor (EF) 3-hydroxypalmitic acid methyl ester biosynthesis protein
MSDTMLFTNKLLGKEEKNLLNHLVEKGGPEPQDYERFTFMVNNLDPIYLDDFREILMPVLNENTLIGHGFTKPFGYPGDFTLINNIYYFHINEDKKYRNWDVFFQNQPAAMAVRNRKEYFLESCRKLDAKNKQDVRVLILGSGPASDVYEFLSANPGSKISFDLIDFDQNAIDFSRKQNEKFNGKISYNRINVLRFKPYKMYDLIWSAGLFDYFKDKHFIYLLRKYINCLSDGGEFVISNFSTDNPTRRLMEVLSEWYLNYRSKADLLHIASEAEIDPEIVRIDTEPLGINLFLKIKADLN